MSKADTLREKKRAYVSLLENVSSFNSKLNKGYNELENSTKIVDYFSIDGESADNGDIKTAREEIREIKDKLTTTIIPAIQSKISRLDNEIDAAETEEMEKV